MTGIDSLSRLYSTLLTRGEKLRRTAGQSRPNAEVETKPRVADRAALQDMVRSRLASLPPGPYRPREACRILIECTLVWQFGEAFVRAGNAQDLVRDIQATLMDSDDYQKLLDEVLTRE